MTMDEKYPLALPEGAVLAGQYTIEKVLGQGGFGITYRATDYKTNQKVAVKEFFPDTLAYREMTTVISYPGERSENYAYGKESFLQEAKTLAEFIGNENIVRIHSYFEENGTAYFVMDYIEGKSFDEYIKEKGGKISVEEAKNILIPVMDALNVVHSKGIVHRDVTPDNIYITNDGTVKLLDFGAARYSLGDRSRSLDVILKHGFAPKEQYTRRGKQGPYTDIYSLAATFYFAITGKRPPDSVERLDEDDLVPPSNLGVDITDYQETAILQALSVQPTDRFVSMAVFKKVLLNENTATNQMVFTAPEAVVAPVVQQAPPVMPQTVQMAQAVQPAQTVQQPRKGKEKKLIIGLSAAGAACALAVVFLIVNAFSGGDTSRRTSADAGNDYYSDNRGDYGDNTTPSPATPKPATPKPATPEPATSEPATTTPATYTTSELCVVGTTAANIKNGGIYTASGDTEFWVNYDGHYLYSSEGSIYEEQEGIFSGLSYYNGILYFLYDGWAYMRDMTTGKDETLIPELEVYGGKIESLYVTIGCYFVYSDGKLYRISRKTGEEEEWIAISFSSDLTLDNGWLYYIGTDSEGKSTIGRVAADDFSRHGDLELSVADGAFSELVVDGNYIYVLYYNYYDATTKIMRLNSDLSGADNHDEWEISSLTGEAGVAWFLNVVGNDLFVCTMNSNGLSSLYRVTINGNGYNSELVDSNRASQPCITRHEEYYEVDYQALDDETGLLTDRYGRYDY